MAFVGTLIVSEQTESDCVCICRHFNIIVKYSSPRQFTENEHDVTERWVLKEAIMKCVVSFIALFLNHLKLNSNKSSAVKSGWECVGVHKSYFQVYNI